jgi:NAD(P)H-hydrate epimerase
MNITILRADNELAIRNRLPDCGLIIDAMLGTGVKGKLRGAVADAVSMINESGRFVVSVDSPTGGNPDNGSIANECVRAGLTVTLGLAKPGLLLYPLAGYTGRMIVGGIGADKVFDEFKSNIFSLDAHSAKAMLPKRYARSHKGTYGKATLVAGSRNMAGAAAYCAKAAYKTGCGYVNICAPGGIVASLGQLAPQAVTTSLPERDGYVFGDSACAALEKINASTVCLIGPGLGNNKDTAAFVKEIIKNANVPLIIDADALNVIADEPDILKAAAHPPAITPHPLEMSRLTKTGVAEITGSALNTCVNFAKKYNAITVLKDASTVIADNSVVYINNGACSALAKAGSGDVLAGMITALAAQGLKAVNACALGVYLHSQSGRTAAEKYGEYSVCCDDIIENLYSVMGCTNF